MARPTSPSQARSWWGRPAWAADPSDLLDRDAFHQRRIAAYLTFVLELFGAFFVLDSVAMALEAPERLLQVGHLSTLAMLVTIAGAAWLVRSRPLPVSVATAVEVAMTLGFPGRGRDDRRQAAARRDRRGPPVGNGLGGGVQSPPAVHAGPAFGARFLPRASRARGLAAPVPARGPRASPGKRGAGAEPAAFPRRAGSVEGARQRPVVGEIPARAAARPTPEHSLRHEGHSVGGTQLNERLGPTRLRPGLRGGGIARGRPAAPGILEARPTPGAHAAEGTPWSSARAPLSR